MVMYNFMMLLFMVGIFVFVCHIYKLLSVMWDMFKTDEFMRSWFDRYNKK